MRDQKFITVNDRLDLVKGPGIDGEETEYFHAWQVVSVLLNTRDAIDKAHGDDEVTGHNVAAIFHDLAMSLVEHIKTHSENEDGWEEIE